MPVGVSILSCFTGKQLCKRLLGAHVLHLEAIKLFLGLNRRGYRQETVETTRIESSVFVLSSAVHNRYPPVRLEQGFLIVRTCQFTGA